MLRQFASSAVRSFGGVKTYATEAIGGQLLVHMGGVFAGEGAWGDGDEGFPTPHPSHTDTIQPIIIAFSTFSI